ncbi:MAG: GGDEF domain-containing protein [Sandaracinaceae bacterium]|nr:GGDEF domain-containing protein [Sandaracinaceae bacterium]
MLGIVGGSGYAVWQGARPDWVLVSYGYVAASAVGLVISWLLERQDALHFFQSILLTSEAEERLRLNQQLETMSRTDSLSGLANRRSFDDTRGRGARMRRERAPLSLVFVDVDHFKRFNDAYGHREGDACLRAVGQALLSGALRPGDVAARYGGEEFVLLLPQTDLAGGEAVAHRVLAAIDQLRIPHGDSPTASHVTISVGGQPQHPTPERRPGTWWRRLTRASTEPRTKGGTACACPSCAGTRCGR